MSEWAWLSEAYTAAEELKVERTAMVILECTKLGFEELMRVVRSDLGERRVVVEVLRV